MARISYSRDVLVDGKFGTGTHFITSEGGGNPYKDSTPVRLSDEAYAEALRTLIIACVDIIIVDSQGHVIIARRQQEPQPDWWVFGGRREASDLDHIASAVRILRRETGILADRRHFDVQPIGHYDYVWDTNAQDDGPCHVEATLLLYRIADEEWDLFQANDEYAAVKPVDFEEILGAPAGTYHPALIKMVRDCLDRLSPAV